tara:strand:- start:646 stop:1137 length:492 start_codon:yes stop_codon:yes gene_type:complete
VAKKNKWEQPSNPPPPLFTGKKERDLVKKINDEIIERVIGQTVVYYPISLDHTNFHSLYGEAINKTFLPPIRVNALVQWQGIESTNTNIGIDKRSSIDVYFHKRRLVEDQNVFVREGDFLLYGTFLYEILSLNEPKEIFGQVEHKMEILAKCKRARRGVFDAT